MLLIAGIAPSTQRDYQQISHFIGCLIPLKVLMTLSNLLRISWALRQHTGIVLVSVIKEPQQKITKNTKEFW